MQQPFQLGVRTFALIRPNFEVSQNFDAFWLSKSESGLGGFPFTHDLGDFDHGKSVGFVGFPFWSAPSGSLFGFPSEAPSFWHRRPCSTSSR